MLFSCFDSSENVGMMRLSLADELKYKLVLYCNRTMKEFCCWCWCNRTMKPLNNLFKDKVLFMLDVVGIFV